MTIDLSKATSDLFIEASKYYNQECVFRADIAIVVQNYEKIAGLYAKKVGSKTNG